MSAMRYVKPVRGSAVGRTVGGTVGGAMARCVVE